MKYFQIRKLHGDFWHQSDIDAFKRRGLYNPDCPQLGCTFKAWDDDGVLYFSGTVIDDPEVFEGLYDFLEADSGTTRVVFYKNGKRYDEIS